MTRRTGGAPDAAAETYDLSIGRRPDYLLASYVGDVGTLPTCLATWRRIAAAAQAGRHRSVLILHRLKVELPEHDMFTFASSLPELGYKDLRVALVNEALEQHEGNLFGEMVAVNRGIDIKVFARLDQAEAWLARPRERK